MECSICPRPAFRTGLCKPHYRRKRRFGDPLGGRPIRQGREGGCSAPSPNGEPCGRPIQAVRLCAKHWMRNKAHGDTSVTKRPALEETVAERLARLVDSSGGPDACHEYTGHRVPFGYGQFSIGHKTLIASRVAWELVNGPIPDGMHVRHTCDNPPCCNVRHLILGSAAENTFDRVVRKRGNPKAISRTRIALGLSKGERNPKAKLNPALVAEIRRRYAAGGISQQALASEHGVNQTLISAIVRNKLWPV